MGAALFASASTAAHNGHEGLAPPLHFWPLHFWAYRWKALTSDLGGRKARALGAAYGLWK